jgi:hypothetical protein
MLPEMMSYGEYLTLRADDARLAALVASLGHELRVEPSDQYGYCVLRELGMDLRFKQQAFIPLPFEGDASAYRLTSVGFYAKGFENYEEYSGPLGMGLNLHFDRDQVRSLLGTPGRSGGGMTIGNTVANEWDRFAVDKYLLMFTYDNAPSKKIGCVTLMLAATIKGGK